MLPFYVAAFYTIFYYIIFLVLFFIYYLNMGIAGAAWATVISAGISCIVMAYWIWVKKDTYMNLSFDQFKKSKGMRK